MKLSIVYYLDEANQNLKNSLDSLFFILTKDIEIIFIDDFCSDEVYKTLSEYDLSQKNIRIVKFSENMGVSYSSNFGLKIAKGEYIYFAEQKTLFSKDFCSIFLSIIENKKKYDFITFDKKLSLLLKEKQSDWEYHNDKSNFDYAFIVNSKLSIKYRIFNVKFLRSNNITFENFKNYHSLFIFDVLEKSTIGYISNQMMVDWFTSNDRSFDYNLYDILKSAEILNNKINGLNISDDVKEAYFVWVSILILYEFIKKIFISYDGQKKIIAKSVTNAKDLIERIYPLYKKNKYLSLLINKKIYKQISEFKFDLNFMKKNIF